MSAIRTTGRLTATIKFVAIGAALLSAGVVLLPTAARAGEHWINDDDAVRLTTSGGNFTAEGSLSLAHNSTDNSQYIYCSITGTAATYSGACYARNAAGTTKSCTFGTTANFFWIVIGISEDSFIHFEGANGGTCTSMTLYKSSAYAPKLPSYLHQ